MPVHSASLHVQIVHPASEVRRPQQNLSSVANSQRHIVYLLCRPLHALRRRRKAAELRGRLRSPVGAAVVAVIKAIVESVAAKQLLCCACAAAAAALLQAQQRPAIWLLLPPLSILPVVMLIMALLLLVLVLMLPWSKALEWVEA